MNKILKIITACFVLPASFLCAGSQEVQDEKQNDYCCVENSFGYLNIGIRGGPLSQLAPSFGIGYRAQKDHHGFDVSGSIDYFHDRTTARLNVLYNYFFKPNPEAQFFAGLGLEAKGINECNGYVVVRPILAVGQEFRTKTGFQHIIQLQVACPDEYVLFPLPEVILSYGFGF